IHGHRTGGVQAGVVGHTHVLPGLQAEGLAHLPGREGGAVDQGAVVGIDEAVRVAVAGPPADQAGRRWHGGGDYTVLQYLELRLESPGAARWFRGAWFT